MGVEEIDNRTDEELIAAYYETEEGRALGRLHERYFRRLLAFFLKLGIAQEDAEDLVQQTFLRIVMGKQNNRGRFDQGEFQSWIFTVAYNLAMDHFRKRKRFRCREESLEQDSECAQLASSGDISEEWAVPEVMADTLAFASALQECLNALDPVDRGLFLLTEYEGFKSNEVGRTMGLKEQQVNVRRCRLRKKMRECLKEKGFEFVPTSVQLSESIAEVVMKFEDEDLVHLRPTS